MKIYNTLIVPTLLYGSENWTLTASQRRRTEAAEMKLLRPLAGYTLQDHKTNDFIRRELQITGILYNIDEYRLKWHLHLQRMPQKWNPVEFISLQTTRKENNWKTEETLARTVVTLETERIELVQSLMYMMMMMISWKSLLSHFTEIRPVVASLIRKDRCAGGRDRRDEANRCFSRLCERA